MSNTVSLNDFLAGFDEAQEVWVSVPTLGRECDNRFFSGDVRYFLKEEKLPDDLKIDCVCLSNTIDITCLPYKLPMEECADITFDVTIGELEEDKLADLARNEDMTVPEFASKIVKEYIEKHWEVPHE